METSGAENQQQSSDPADGWFYLHPNGQNYGPYPPAALQDLYRQGYLRAEFPVWKQGLAEWQPFSQVPEVFDGSAPPSHPPATTGTNGTTHQAAAVVLHAPTQIDEMARFQAEIGQLEAQDEAPGSPEEKRFQEDDGTWYTWDSRLRKYVPEGIDAAAAGTAAGLPHAPEYDPADMVFEEEEAAVPSLPAVVVNAGQHDDEHGDAVADELENERRGKRKAEHAGDDAEDEQWEGEQTNPQTNQQPTAGSRKKAKQQKQRVNTSVYVTGLPDDVTEAELAHVFRKCGLIKEDDEGHPRVKVYRDKETGRAKGDGLVTYLKEPSVLLAVQILDGVQFRLGQGKPMTVAEATFEDKGDAAAPQKKGPRRGPKGPKKKKAPNKAEEQLGWDGFDDTAKEEDATVVLKNMFDPDEVQGNKGLIKDLHTDVADECRKHGSIGRIKIFAWNPEGVVSVRFMTTEAADACVKALNGRPFGGRRIVAGLWDGFTNFFVEPPKETEEEQAARLEAFAKKLEEGDDD